MDHLLCVQIHDRFQDRAETWEGMLKATTACFTEKNTDIEEKGSWSRFPHVPGTLQTLTNAEACSEATIKK